MIKKLLLLFTVSFLITSCGSKKKVVENTNKTTSTTVVSSSTNTTTENVIANARNYLGTPYQYGGTDHSGMDCSGLLYKAFQQENISLPRVSYVMAERGYKINLNEVKKGDFLFFRTNRRNNRISHVGLVTEVNNGNITFIHSSKSRGVTETPLSNVYWSKSFAFAKRLL